MKKLRPGNKGFSLVELMVTIGLFAILCLAAFPQFMRLAENSNLKAATRDITTDIATMKETAMNRGADCQITFNAGADSFVLTTPEGNTIKTLATFSRDIVITSANFFEGGQTLIFEPRGTATNGTVILTNNRGSTATITVNITGRAYAEYTMQ